MLYMNNPNYHIMDLDARKLDVVDYAFNPLKEDHPEEPTYVPIHSANKQADNQMAPNGGRLSLNDNFAVFIKAKAQQIAEPWRSRLNKVKKAFEIIKKNMFPKVLKRFYHKYGLKHVVLLMLVTAYSLLGALTFVCLEQPAQLHRFEIRDQILTEKRAEFINAIFGQVFNDTDTYLLFIDSHQSKTISKIMQNQLVKYESNIIENLHYYKMKIKWDFGNAVLFSWTLITTIGYGHMYPMTQGGRIATMIYALVGIPLTLVCLQDLAELEKKDRETLDVFDLPIPIAIAIVVGWILVCSAIQILWEKEWSFFDAFYFFYISLSTIGLGDIEPSEPKYLLIMFGNIIIGLSLVSMCINLISSRLEKTYQAGQSSHNSSPLNVQDMLGRHKPTPEDEEEGISIGSAGKVSFMSSKSAPNFDSGVLSINSQQSGSLHSPRWVRMKMFGSSPTHKSKSLASDENKIDQFFKSLPEVSQPPEIEKPEERIEFEMESGGQRSRSKRSGHPVKRRSSEKKRTSQDSSAQTPEHMWSTQNQGPIRTRSKIDNLLKSSVSFNNLREHKEEDSSTRYSHEKITQRCSHYSVKQAAAQLKRELSMYENWSPLRADEFVAQIEDEAVMKSLSD